MSSYEKDQIAVATPTANTPGVSGVVMGDKPMFEDDTKQGHVCCSCCCDVRRAVIILNVISLVLTVLNAGLYSAAVGIYANLDENDYDDDKTSNAISDIQENSPLNGVAAGVIIGYAVVAIIFYALGIYGAKNYKNGMVLAATLFHGIDVVFATVSLNIIGIVIAVLFLYPHIVLYSEIKKGIMSPETLKREEHSCCCV